MRFHIPAVAFLAFMTTAVVAQQATTRPVADDWAARSERFLSAIVGGDASGARRLSAEAVVVVRGGTSPEQSELATLAHRVRGGAVLATHHYTFPPIALAADLAADFKSSPAVSDELRGIMVPTDDDAMQRANATAIQWAASQLGLTPGTPFSVAMILPVTTSGSEKLPAPILVLTKGTTGADGAVNVSRVVYGTPRQLME